MCKNPVVAAPPAVPTHDAPSTSFAPPPASFDRGDAHEVYVDELSPVTLGAAGDGPFTVPTTSPFTFVTAKINGMGFSGPPPLKPLLAPLKSLSSRPRVTRVMSVEDKSVDVAIVPDELLLQLAGEGLGEARPITEPLKVECIKFTLEQGQAVLSYDPSLANEERRKKLMQVSFHDFCGGECSPLATF